MSPSRQHREPVENDRMEKSSRRLRRNQRARAVHQPPTEEVIIVTKQKRMEQKWIHEQESEAESAKFEMVVHQPVVDPAVAAREVYETLMTDPLTAPDWARVRVNEFMIAAPTTPAEIEAKITALEQEHADALARLNAVQDAQRGALNALLAQKREAEEAEIAAANSQLPEQMKASLADVRKFVSAPEVVVAAPVDYVARGREALDRALRRSRGEVIEEPVYNDPAPGAPTSTSSKQAELRARVADKLAMAEQTRAALQAWFRDFGKTFQSLHVATDDESGGHAEREMIDDLVRGLPSTTSVLQMQSLSLVSGLLRGVRSALTLATTMRDTVDRESREVDRIISRVDAFGPLISQGDKSSGWYDLERQLGGALHRLGSANSDGIETLNTITKGVAGALERIVKAREECAGQPQPVLEWHNPGAVLEGIDAAKRLQHGRPSVGEAWGVFDGEAK